MPLSVTLFEKMTFHPAFGRYFSLMTNKGSISNNQCIEPMQNYEWNGESSSFTLPSLRHTTCEKSSRIIVREYFLRLKARHMNKNSFYLKIPVTIGNLSKIYKSF